MKKVIIYTTPTCHYCHMAKEFFQENNIEYKEFNVVEDEQAKEEMIKKSQNLAVPVIDVEGEIIIGFDKARLEKLLLSK